MGAGGGGEIGIHEEVECMGGEKNGRLARKDPL